MFVSQDPGDVVEMADFRQSFLQEASTFQDILVLPTNLSRTECDLFVDWWADATFSDLDFVVKHNASRSLANWSRVLEFLATRDVAWTQRPLVWGWVTVVDPATDTKIKIEPDLFALSMPAARQILEAADTSDKGELDLALAVGVDVRHSPNIPPTAATRQQLRKTFSCDELWLWWGTSEPVAWSEGLSELMCR